jgi:hypothetical protein
VTEREYAGGELELFSAAVHWKQYLASHISPFLGRRVAEIGAGLGATAEILCAQDRDRWVCLEPDVTLAREIESRIARKALPPYCEVIVGTLENLPPDERVDTVLYVDVLEHIEDDRAEVRAAIERLAVGGQLVVLAPAHSWLFTPFDLQVGHYRRYTKRTLEGLMPPTMRRQTLRYLDALGMAASAVNRVLLRQSLPTPRQIRLWDGLLVPCSRAVDPLLNYTIGKSVFGVWRRV